MPHSFGKHDVVEYEDQGLIRPKSGTRVLRTLLFPRLVPVHSFGWVKWG